MNANKVVTECEHKWTAWSFPYKRLSNTVGPFLLKQRTCTECLLLEEAPAQ